MASNTNSLLIKSNIIALSSTICILCAIFVSTWLLIVLKAPALLAEVSVSFSLHCKVFWPVCVEACSRYAGVINSHESVVLIHSCWMVKISAWVRTSTWHSDHDTLIEICWNYTSELAGCYSFELLPGQNLENTIPQIFCPWIWVNTWIWNWFWWIQIHHLKWVANVSIL